MKINESEFTSSRSSFLLHTIGCVLVWNLIASIKSYFWMLGMHKTIYWILQCHRIRQSSFTWNRLYFKHVKYKFLRFTIISRPHTRVAESRRPICVGFTLTTIVSWFVIPDYPGTIPGLGRVAANKWCRTNEWWNKCSRVCRITNGGVQITNSITFYFRPVVL